MLFLWLKVATLVRELRLELDRLLQDKIESPSMDLATCPRGSKIIQTIVRLVTTQWHLKLIPSVVGAAGQGLISLMIFHSKFRFDGIFVLLSYSL